MILNTRFCAGARSNEAFTMMVLPALARTLEALCALAFV
jgi:hypothetical protein